MITYTLYEKQVNDSFAGAGVETLVCKDGKILAHVRGWTNQQVVESFRGALEGKSESERGPGWRKVVGSKERASQTWAAELVDYKSTGW